MGRFIRHVVCLTETDDTLASFTDLRQAVRYANDWPDYCYVKREHVFIEEDNNEMVD